MALAAHLTNTKDFTLPDKGLPERVDQVVIDALVAFKILKHARENPYDTVRGTLVGLVHQHNLEITNCFSAIVFEDDESPEKKEAEAEFHTLSMLRCLREVNVDHLEVGWYLASPLGTYFHQEAISLQFSHQTENEEAVFLVYDPVHTINGSLEFKAFRLTKKFMQQFSDSDFSPAKVKKMQLSFNKIFEEVPVVIRCSQLARVLVDEFDREITKDHQETFDRLDLSTHHFLEKTIRSLMTSVDELSGDLQKYFYYMRNSARQQQLQLQQRKKENEERIKQGLEPLPEDDILADKAPSLLSSLLINGQIDNYCSQISQFASQSFGKLFLAQGLQQQSQQQQQ